MGIGRSQTVRLPEEGSSAWTDLVARVRKELIRDRLAVLPAEGLYGLHACTQGGRARLEQLKGGRPGRPFIVLLAESEDLARYAAPLPPTVLAWIASVWPAPLTLVLPARSGVPQHLTHEDQIALRCPASRFLRAIAAGCDGPLLSTSANRSGSAAPARVSELEPAVSQAAAVIVDAGPLPGTGSTVARLDPDAGVEILRAGLWVDPGSGTAPEAE